MNKLGAKKHKFIRDTYAGLFSRIFYLYVHTIRMYLAVRPTE